MKPENIPEYDKDVTNNIIRNRPNDGQPRAAAALETIDNDYQNVVISVSESTIHVSGAAGQMLAVYDLAGMRVAYLKIDSAEKHFDLGLPKGCYIVKVGKMVRKIAVR